MYLCCCRYVKALDRRARTMRKQAMKVGLHAYFMAIWTFDKI